MRGLVPSAGARLGELLATGLGEDVAGAWDAGAEELVVLAGAEDVGVSDGLADVGVEVGEAEVEAEVGAVDGLVEDGEALGEAEVGVADGLRVGDVDGAVVVGAEDEEDPDGCRLCDFRWVGFCVGVVESPPLAKARKPTTRTSSSPTAPMSTQGSARRSRCVGGGVPTGVPVAPVAGSASAA